MRSADYNDPTGFGSAGDHAREIDAKASQWVIRHRAGLDESGECKLEAWLADDIAHKDAFARLSAMSAVLQRAHAQGATNAIVTQLAVRARRRSVRRKTLVAGAASALLLIYGVWFHPLSTLLSPPQQNIAKAFESVRRLPDGSIVELNESAEIVVRYERAVRLVELVRGEALFHVEKDPERSFIVRAAGVEVRAVGTAFNVRVDEATVEVLVTEGRVGIDDADRGESLLPDAPTGTPVLLAGQKIVIKGVRAADVPLSVNIAQVAPSEIKERLSWRHPRLEFDGMELAHAVEQMNRQNRLQIVIGDDSLKKLRISGTFLSDNPQTFARLVAATFGFEADRRSTDEIVLRKK